MGAIGKVQLGPEKEVGPVGAKLLCFSSVHHPCGCWGLRRSVPWKVSCAQLAIGRVELLRWL